MARHAGHVDPRTLYVGHAVGRTAEKNNVSCSQVGDEGTGQFSKYAAFGIEHKIGIVGSDGTDVGIVNHSRIAAFSENVLFPVDPNSTLFLEHIQHFNEIIVLEIPIRPRIHNDFKGLVNVKFVDDDQTDDELGDNVQAVLWEVQSVHITRLDGRLQRSQFNEIVNTGRQKSSTRDATDVVTSTTDALERRGDISGTADLQHQVNRPDVNTHFQRRGRDDGT